VISTTKLLRIPPPGSDAGLMDGIQRCAGINVTASKLQFAEVEKESDKLFVTRIGQTFISPQINFEEQDDPDLQLHLQNAFDEIKIRNPLVSTVASLTLPPELFITIQLPYDSNLNHSDISEEFRWEISQLYPYIAAENMAIKFYELDKNFLPGNNNALVVALNKKYLLMFKNFCSHNKMTPRLVDNASVAANGFISSNLAHKMNSVTVNIYNSKLSFTLFVNLSSRPAYVKVFQKKESETFNAISNELSHDKIKKALSKTQAAAYISGEDIGEDSIMEIKRRTGLEFKRFNPFKIISFKNGYQNNEVSDEHFCSFTPAAGIASRNF
jgi:Tfp pilus assembly PilM family ATPase